MVIHRFVQACSADERIVAAFLGGSVARGEADEFSDLDLCLITKDDALEEVKAGRADLIRTLGEPLFLEDFGSDVNVFFILADGTEGEIFFFGESELDRIDAGPVRTLLDEQGLLADVRFPVREPDRAEQVEELRRVMHWFWHDLSHFIAALGRGQLWWAAGQLEMLRAYCVNLERIDQGVEAEAEAYEKLDQLIAIDRLAPIRSTFPPMERDAMLRASLALLAFFRERAPVVGREHGLSYPLELEHVISNRLEELARR